jgi:hypothetical protein
MCCMNMNKKQETDGMKLAGYKKEKAFNES